MEPALQDVLAWRLTRACVKRPDEVVLAHEARVGQHAVRDPLAESLLDEGRGGLKWFEQRGLPAQVLEAPRRDGLDPLAESGVDHRLDGTRRGQVGSGEP